MLERVYVITDCDGKTTRIRAFSFDYINLGSGFWALKFFEEGKKDHSAQVTVQMPYSVIPQDMLFESLAESLLYPVMPSDTESGLDFLKESLFSEAEKKPFTLEERRLLANALQSSKAAIHATFSTSNIQRERIDEKLDYLTEKVAELDRFNWKRLFISVLVGISVDLGFGTMIPSALVAAIQEVLTHIIEKARAKIGDKNRLPKA